MAHQNAAMESIRVLQIFLSANHIEVHAHKGTALAVDRLLAICFARKQALFECVYVNKQ